MTHDMIQARNIRIVGGISIFFGVLSALAALPSLNTLLHPFFDLVIWPATDTLRPLTAEARLATAILGGIFAGFGVIFWVAAGSVYPVAPEATRKMLLAGAITWFAVDSTGSVLAGAAGNVPPNILFFGLFLWALRRPAIQVQANA